MKVPLRWLRVTQYAFAVAGILALGYCAAVRLDAKIFEATEARNFDAELRLIKGLRPAAHPGPAGAAVVPQDGGVVGRLEVPRIGISVMVVEGVDDDDLKRAVGHIPGTALPGQAGNVGIAGHRDTFFRPLRKIQPNDTVDLITRQEVDHYRVVSTKVVPPEDVGVLYPTGRDVLTLVTCFPFDYVGSAPKRFIVRAERLPGT